MNLLRVKEKNHPQTNMTGKKLKYELQMDSLKLLRVQICIYCIVNDLHLSEGELECLIALVLNKDQALHDFCKSYVNPAFTNAQSVRNTVGKLEKKGLVQKTGKKKKTMVVSESLFLQVGSYVNIIYDIKNYETKK